MELRYNSTPMPFYHFSQWAHNCPGQIALIELESGRQVMYKQLERKIDITTYRLLEMGIEAGDRVAVALPFSIEYVCLMMASWRVGAIFAPIDPEIPFQTQMEQLAVIEAKFFAFHKPLPIHTKKYLTNHCPYIAHYLHIRTCTAADNRNQNNISSLCEASRLSFRYMQQRYQFRLKRVKKEQHLWSPALIIFKEKNPQEAVLLSHYNLLLQIKNNQRLFGLGPYDKTFVSLPSSHTGGVVTSLLSAITNGATAVLCSSFEPHKTKSALEKHYVTHLFQRKDDFKELWNEINQSDFEPMNLRFAASVDGRADLTYLSNMESFAEESGTGLFLDEAGGFVSFCSSNYSINTFSQHVGMAISDFSKISIREPRTFDQRAGELIPEGLVGEICIESKSIFLGYYNNTDATSKALCKEDLLYTGMRGRLIFSQNEYVLSIETQVPHQGISAMTA